MRGPPPMWQLTRGWRYSSKLPVHTEPQMPACRFHIQEFRLTKNSAAYFYFHIYFALYSHDHLLWQELKMTAVCMCMQVRSCLMDALLTFGSSQLATLWSKSASCSLGNESSWPEQTKLFLLVVLQYVSVGPVAMDLKDHCWWIRSSVMWAGLDPLCWYSFRPYHSVVVVRTDLIDSAHILVPLMPFSKRALLTWRLFINLGCMFI